MSKVITIPGLAPRLIPSNDGHRLPTLRDSEEIDDLRAKFTLSHFHTMMQSAHYIAENEGKDKAVEKLSELISWIQVQK